MHHWPDTNQLSEFSIDFLRNPQKGVPFGRIACYSLYILGDVACLISTSSDHRYTCTSPRTICVQRRRQREHARALWVWRVWGPEPVPKQHCIHGPLGRCSMQALGWAHISRNSFRNLPGRKPSRNFMKYTSPHASTC